MASRDDRELEPTLSEIRAVLELFVSMSMPDPWYEAIADQVSHVVGVVGPYWNTTLIIEGDPPPVPRGTPIPLNRKLETRLGVEPDGTILLWIDDRTGVIASVEFATYVAETVDRYPTPEELSAWP